MSKRVQLSQIMSKRVSTSQNKSKRVKMIQTDSNWVKSIKNWVKLRKKDQNSTFWTKIGHLSRKKLLFIETKKIYFVVKIIRMTTNGTRKRQRRDLFSFFLFTKYFFRKTTFFFFNFFWNVRCMLWYVFFLFKAHTIPSQWIFFPEF